MTNEELINKLMNEAELDNDIRDIAAVVKERDEALNQLDSSRHSVDVLEKRLTDKMAKLAKAVEALQTIAKRPLYDGFLLVWWIDSTIKLAAATLKELEKTE